MHPLRRLGRRILVPAALGSLTALSMVGMTAATAAPATPVGHVQPQPVVAGVVLVPRPVRYVLPVVHYHLTGRFGDASGLWSHRHTGLDFAAPIGTPIRSVGAGTVVDTEYDGAYGNRTRVRLEDGTVLWYCHQVRWLVHPGQRVEPGQVIGLVGNTGNVTGPHLHLEVHPHHEPVDPEHWLREQGLHP